MLADKPALKVAALACALLPCTMSAATSLAPTPPSVLAPYIVDGEFRPGDYYWLRGMFEGATPKQIADYREIEAWRGACFRSDVAAVRAELKDVGVIAGPELDRMPYATVICGQVASLPERLDAADWSGFSRDVAITRPTIDGFLDAVRLSGNIGLADSDDFGPALIARALEDQTLRAGLAWSANPDAFKGTRGDLSSRQRSIFRAAISVALTQKDHENTGWLKQQVAKRGWPKKSEVGRLAAKMAWLLVQHADADPVFQVRALRLMEPLVANGEVEGSDFAFLLDRIMLKISSKQRYGTQLECTNGRLEPLPLQDINEVASRRRAVGLNDLDAYKAETLKAIGGCETEPSASKD
ncbi:MAG: hypothetical protein K2Y20_08540 [Sphingomonas sp.]|nr:hypothetical protein [Sphingomonas sp.]